MFVVNDDMSIYLTRGDTAIFSVTADNNGKNYVFQPGDVVRMKVTEKKACENVMFQKDFPVTEEAEKVDILLTEEETKIGEVISKPTDYWYEIELNPYTNPQTIVGYDEDGAKILRLFPEGIDLEPTPIEPTDIPVVDNALSLTSDRPVQNQAISRAITGLGEDIKYVRDSGSERMATIEGKITAEANRRSEEVARLENDIAVERARISTLAANTGEQTEGNAELLDIRVGADSKTYATAGDAVRGQVGELKETITNETTERKNAYNDLRTTLDTETSNRKVSDNLLKTQINSVESATSEEERRAKSEEKRIEELFTLPAEEAVEKWLEEHPEATTTVQDGSLTESKMHIEFLPHIKNDYVTPQMFGAKGDGITDDTQAVQQAFNSVGENGCVVIPQGLYLVSSVSLVKSNVQLIMQGTFKQIAGHNGDLLTVRGRYVVLDNIKLFRDCEQTGKASEDLKNSGLVITESKNVTLRYCDITNFNVGVLIHSDGTGCAYIDIYTPQIVAYEGIKSAGTSWTNEIHIFGGRISIHGSYDDYVGSSYLNLKGDCNRIFGMCLEGTQIERKIKGGFSNSLFIGCRFEGMNSSGTDIEVFGSWNAFIHNRDMNENIINTGEGNNFLDFASYKINSAIQKPIKTFASTESNSNFVSSWQTPIILVDASETNATIEYPYASDKYVKGTEFTVKKVDSTANTVWVYAKGKIDEENVILKMQNETITFFSDGNNWRIKEHHVPIVEEDTATRKPITILVSTDSENEFNMSIKNPLVIADATVANMTVGYPYANAEDIQGVEFTVKKIDDTPNTVWIYTRGYLDGGNVTLKVLNESITFFSDGSKWRIKEHYIPQVAKNVAE
jgi:hypothetical protein